MSDTPRSEPEREGETLDESLAALWTDGLIEPMRDENGEVVYRNGQVVWVPVKPEDRP